MSGLGKIDKGHLSINLSDLADAMSNEDKRELAKVLAADDLLFGAILECVADDSRWGHFFGDDADGLWSFDSRRVLELREKLLPLMSTIARNAVREALAQRNQAKAAEASTSRWAWAMYHAWPGLGHDRPEGPPRYEPGPDVREDELPAKEES